MVYQILFYYLIICLMILVISTIGIYLNRSLITKTNPLCKLRKSSSSNQEIFSQPYKDLLASLLQTFNNQVEEIKHTQQNRTNSLNTIKQKLDEITDQWIEDKTIVQQNNINVFLDNITRELDEIKDQWIEDKTIVQQNNINALFVDIKQELNKIKDQWIKDKTIIQQNDLNALFDNIKQELDKIDARRIEDEKKAQQNNIKDLLNNIEQQLNHLWRENESNANYFLNNIKRQLDLWRENENNANYFLNNIKRQLDLWRENDQELQQNQDRLFTFTYISRSIVFLSIKIQIFIAGFIWMTWQLGTLNLGFFDLLLPEKVIESLQTIAHEDTKGIQTICNQLYFIPSQLGKIAWFIIILYVTVLCIHRTIKYIRILLKIYSYEWKLTIKIVLAKKVNHEQIIDEIDEYIQKFLPSTQSLSILTTLFGRFND